MQRSAHPFNPGRPHPCWPVPLAEQRRLVTVARLALHELLTGDADQALVDLLAVGGVVAALLDHYTVEDGRLAPGSDLWMGALLLPGNSIATPPGHIHTMEWLDFRPIPEIEGEHTTDKKLIGVK